MKTKTMTMTKKYRTALCQVRHANDLVRVSSLIALYNLSIRKITISFFTFLIFQKRSWNVRYLFSLLSFIILRFFVIHYFWIIQRLICRVLSSTGLIKSLLSLLRFRTSSEHNCPQPWHVYQPRMINEPLNYMLCKISFHKKRSFFTFW